jgi:hypothetical protein
MTNDPSSLVFNIERVDASDLRAQKKHDNREGTPLPNVYAKRSHLNRVLIGTGDPLADAEAEEGGKTKKTTTRKTATKKTGGQKAEDGSDTANDEDLGLGE